MRTFTKREADICKGIAICMMLFHHLFNDYEEYAGFTVIYAPFSGERITFFALVLKICVAIFVFISGYGLAATYSRQFANKQKTKSEVAQFVWSKYWKLMTTYWFAFAITLLCQPLGRTIFDAYGNNIKEIILYMFIDIMGLADLFSTPTLNPTWWYMSMAIAIIVIIPFIMYLVEKFTAIMVLVLFVILTQGNALNSVLNFYLFSVVLGVVSYETRLFDKINQIGKRSRFKFGLTVLVEVFLLLVLLSLRTNYNFNGIVDGLLALDLAVLVCAVVGKIPLVSKGLKLLGENSANIFLLHNQLYSFYFLAFFYSFKYWFLIFGVLTGVSLIVSYGVDWLKNKIGYAKMMVNIGKAIENKII